jgi:hypothetical protein
MGNPGSVDVQLEAPDHAAFISVGRGHDRYDAVDGSHQA